MKTWATFSIIDHRRPIYRQALALFDRIVVPLPLKPIGDQTQEELDQLKVEIDYLKGANAAEPYEWKSTEFEEWRKPILAESLAAGLNRDAYLDTRLMLSQQFYSPDVQAIPVYGGLQHFADSRKALNGGRASAHHRSSTGAGGGQWSGSDPGSSATDQAPGQGTLFQCDSA
jgi:hypothetical protein